MLKELLKLVKPYWGRILVAALMGLVIAGSLGLLAWIVKYYIDMVLVEHRLDALKTLPFMFFGLFLVKGVFTFFQNFIMRGTGAKIIREIRGRLFRHLMRMRFSFYQK